MKVFYLTKIKTTSLLLSIFALVSLSSCGSYQSAYNDDDGIYNSSSKNESSEIKETVDNNEQEYFTKSYEEYMNIQDGDLITNVDDYYYDDQLEGANNDESSNYSGATPWGYSDNTSVTINVGNGFGHPFYNNYYGFNNFYPYYGNFYSAFNYNPWFRNRFYNTYSFYNNSFYCPPFYGSSFYNGYGSGFGYFGGSYYAFGRSNYYRHYDTYGPRTAYNSRRNATNRRNISSITNSNRSSTRRVLNDNVRSTRRVSSDLNNTRTIRNTSGTRTVRNTGNTTRTRTTRTPSRTRSSSNNTRTRSSSPSRTRTSTTRSTSRSSTRSSSSSRSSTSRSTPSRRR